MKRGGHCLFVIASHCLLLATIACGIALFAPYWLCRVTSPWPGAGGKGPDIEGSGGPSYIVVSNHSIYTATDFIWRGLWAQCSGDCQWFWAHSFRLQHDVFTALQWHLATQVLYSVGVFLVLFCEFFARAQLCCRQRRAIYRSVGFILLTAFVIQAAAIAVFGGFANRDYGATAFSSDKYTYLAWTFWMAVSGGGFTLISGVLFLLMDWIIDPDDEDG